MAGPATTAVAPADNKRKESKRMMEAQKTYGRGKSIHTHSVRDKKLRSNLKAVEDKYKEAALKAKDAEILLEHDAGFLEPEAELERTYKVRQDEIRESVGIETERIRCGDVQVLDAEKRGSKRGSLAEETSAANGDFHIHRNHKTQFCWHGCGR